MSAPRGLRERLRDATAAVATARENLGEGRVADLAGLEDEVGEICRQITAAPAAQARELKPGLVALAEDLDRLGRELAEVHEKLASEIGGLTAREKATRAYGRGPGPSR